MLAFPMNLNTLLEYLLKEAALKPEAPKDAPLGRYLFAPQRKDTPTPKEQNTGGEDALLTSLERFYSSGGSKETETTLKQLLNLKNQDQYLKLLKPPSGLAYRFVGNLTPEQASKQYLNNLPVEDIISEPNVAFYVEPIGIVKDPAYKSTYQLSKSKLSSWTIAPTKPVFASFAYSKPGGVSVVLVADIDSNNFIMNPKQLAKNISSNLLPLDIIKKEQEIIGYGPINCLEAAAIYIGQPIMFHTEQDKIYNKVPPELDLVLSQKKTIIKPAVFKKTFDYINALLTKYKDKMSPRDYLNILKDQDYRLLTKYAKEGLIVDGSFSQTYNVSMIGENCVFSIIQAVIRNNSIHDGNIQEKLLKALNLKIKKY